jgi:hypothetical protein
MNKTQIQRVLSGIRAGRRLNDFTKEVRVAWKEYRDQVAEIRHAAPGFKYTEEQLLEIIFDSKPVKEVKHPKIKQDWNDIIN